MLPPKQPKVAVRAPTGTVSFDRISAQTLEWLWPGRFPLGKISLLAGYPGMSKSLVSIDLCARVTTGTPFPDCPDVPTPRGTVLMLNPEDDPADTIKPRLLAAGADVKAVHYFDPFRSGSSGPFRLDVDLPVLRRRMKELGNVRLVIIDPLSAFWGRVDPNRDSAVRQVLGPLGQLAAEHRATVLLVVHLNKTVRGNPISGLPGSIGLVGAARAAWLVGIDPDDSSRRVLAPVKMNMAKDSGALGYQIEEAAVAGSVAPRIVWDTSPNALSVSDVIGVGDRRPSPPTELQRAVIWLRATTERGPVPAEKLMKMAASEGFKERTLDRAKVEAEVHSRRCGKGWVWERLDSAPAKFAKVAN